LAARFEAKSPTDLALSIYERPDEFGSADLEADELGENDNARTLLLLLRDRDLIAVRDTSRAHRDWLLRGGKILRGSGDLAGALAFLGRAADSDPKDAEIQFQIGLVHLIREDKDAAKANFLAGMLQDPEHGGIHFNLATILEDEGDLLGSEIEYRAATLHLDDPAPAHARLGGVLMKLGRSDEARGELERVRRLAPGSDAEQYLSRALSTP
jgi:tetratricopeptide (TPR) repeat protein